MYKLSDAVVLRNKMVRIRDELTKMFYSDCAAEMTIEERNKTVELIKEVEKMLWVRDNRPEKFL